MIGLVALYIVSHVGRTSPMRACAARMSAGRSNAANSVSESTRLERISIGYAIVAMSTATHTRRSASRAADARSA